MKNPSGSTRRQDAERARANASPEGTRAMDGPRNPTLSAINKAQAFESLGFFVLAVSAYHILSHTLQCDGQRWHARTLAGFDGPRQPQNERSRRWEGDSSSNSTRACARDAQGK